MNIDSLRDFLTDSNNSGYATGDSADWTKEDDGSTTIINKSGDWRLKDNFFGGEPYGGHVIVFYNNKPYWMLVYYGDVHDTELDHNSVYEFLKKALTKPPEEAPYRGPAELIEGDWEYKNKWEGKLERYAGEEVILLSGKEVYSAWYAGGLVDQR